MKRKADGYLGDRPLAPSTLMMSYGFEPGRSEGALKCPIFQTSTFAFETAEEGKAFFEIAYGLRERGGRYGLTALCIGMGMGCAILWEHVG